MKPINFLPANTSAYHLWSLHFWQEKHQKAVGYALEVLCGEYAFWAIKKGHLFAQALAVVQHDRTLQLVTEKPALMVTMQPFAYQKPAHDIEFSFAIDLMVKP